MNDHSPVPWTWALEQVPVVGEVSLNALLQMPVEERLNADQEEPGEVVIRDAHGEPVASLLATLEYLDTVGRDARRIVACVNACTGIPTESLESVTPDNVVPMRQAITALGMTNDLIRADLNEALRLLRELYAKNPRISITRAKVFDAFLAKHPEPSS